MLGTEKSTEYLEKSMDFFGKFCSLLKLKNMGNDDEGLDHPLLVDIFSYLLQVCYTLINIYISFFFCFNNMVL